MEDNKFIDLSCIDCDKCTIQKYRGQLSDESQLYVCEECGCENHINDNEN